MYRQLFVTMLVGVVVGAGCAPRARCSGRPFDYEGCGRELTRLEPPEREPLLRALYAKDRELCIGPAWNVWESGGGDRDPNAKVAARPRACVYAAIEAMGLGIMVFGRREGIRSRAPTATEIHEGLDLLRRHLPGRIARGLEMHAHEAEVMAVGLNLLLAAHRLGLYEEPDVGTLEADAQLACTAWARWRLGAERPLAMATYATQLCTATQLAAVAGLFPAHIQASTAAVRALADERSRAEAAERKPLEDAIAAGRARLQAIVDHPDPFTALDELVASARGGGEIQYAYERAARDILARLDLEDRETLHKLLARERDDTAVTGTVLAALKKLRATHEAALAAAGEWTFARAEHLEVLIAVRHFENTAYKTRKQPDFRQTRELQELRAAYQRAMSIQPRGIEATGSCAPASAPADTTQSPFGRALRLDATCRHKRVPKTVMEPDNSCGRGGGQTRTTYRTVVTGGPEQGCITDLNGNCSLPTKVVSETTTVGGGGGACKTLYREKVIHRDGVELRGTATLEIAGKTFVHTVDVLGEANDGDDAFKRAALLAMDAVLKRADVRAAARAEAERRRSAATSEAERTHWSYALKKLVAP